MRFEPGFMKTLRDDINSIDDDIKEIINDFNGLPCDHMLSLVTRPGFDDVAAPESITDDEIMLTDENDTDAGIDALVQGDAALCIIADRIIEHDPSLKATIQRSKHVWLLTYDDVMDENLIDAVRCHPHGVIIHGFKSCVLTPFNRIEFIKEGVPALHQCGDGDVLSALQKNNILHDFIASGGKNVLFVKSDSNINAAVATLGSHIRTHSQLTCEATRRVKNDDRCFIAYSAGKPQAILPQRLDGADIEDYTWVCTGACALNLKCFLRDCHAELAFHRTRVIREKKVFVEYKRSLLELSEHKETKFVRTS